MTLAEDVTIPRNRKRSVPKIGDARKLQGIPLKIYLDSAQIYCKSNAVLSSKFYRYFSANNHCIVGTPSEADFIVVNTCSFCQGQYNHTISLFEKYSNIERSQARVVAIGCIKKIYPHLTSLYPEIIFLSNPEEYDRYFAANVKYSDVRGEYVLETGIDSLHHDNSWRGTILVRRYHSLRSFMNRFLVRMLGDVPVIRKEQDEYLQRNKAYVEIGRGCAGQCTYCVVKKARGDPVSRPIEDILEDVETVYDERKSLYLVADDCGSYGLDIGTNLIELLWAIHDRFPRVGIDLCYVNAHWIEQYADQYLEVFERININSINVTLQSGSDRIIQLMNRKYSVDNVLRVVEAAKKLSPGTFFWSHFMVGFPSETDEDFKRTLKAARSFSFAYLFRYSDMEGTPAALFGNKVPWYVKTLRELRLILFFLYQICHRFVKQYH